ncbi:unnamed protein product [Heterobilharzia americana]|nr:unnamed protein product [Heterobilharzia americana]
MIALLYCSSVVRVIDLPECSLFNREINYGCGPFYSLRHFPVDLFHKTSQNTHTISKVKIFSICLPEFKYLYDASLDHNFTTLLSRYLKCSKNLPALFIISLYQREICDVPMWQVVCSRLVKSIVIEESMAWLSTLGGGYSSLGDQMIMR